MFEFRSLRTAINKLTKMPKYVNPCNLANDLGMNPTADKLDLDLMHEYVGKSVPQFICMVMYFIMEP